jgi:hypothetical protein
VKAFVGLHAFQDEQLDSAFFDVEIRTRDGMLSPTKMLAATATPSKRLFRIEVR